MAKSSMIGSLRIALGLDSAQFQAGVANANKSLDGMAKRAAEFGTKFGLALAGAAGAFGTFLKMTANSAAATGDVADRFGVAVESLQELRHAAEMSGIGVQNFDMAFRRFLRRSSEAARGTGAAKNAFAELGITLTDNQKRMRNVEDIFDDVADAMQKIQDPTNKLRLAFQIFDTDGAAMVKMFENGAEGIRKFREQARDLGIVLSGDTVRAAQRFNDSLSLIAKLSEGFRNRLFAAVIPAFEHLAARIFDVASNARVFDGVAKGLSGALNLLARGIGFVLDHLDDLIDLFKVFVAAKIVMFLASVSGAMIALARTIATTGSVMVVFTRITRAKITTLALLGAVIAKVTGTYEALVDWIGRAGQAIMDALPESLRTGVEELGQSIKGLFGDINALNTQTANSFATYLSAYDDIVTSFSDTEKAAKKAADEQRRAAEAYRDIVSDAQDFIAAQRMEQQAIGLTEQAANALRYEFALLADAKRSNINLTPQQTQELSGLAQAMAAAQESTRRLREAFDFAKDTTKGFFTDLMQGIRSGEGLWQSFANAALSALDKITQKLLDMALDEVINGFLRSLLGGIGGGLNLGGRGFFPPAPSVGLYAKGTNSAKRGLAIVGEEGPELVSFRGGEQVIPNHELGNLGSGGGRIAVDVGVSVDNDGNLQAYVKNVAEQTTAAGIGSYDKTRQRRYRMGAQFG